MQTTLILGTVEIISPHFINGLVVGPQEIADYAVEYVRQQYMRPTRFPPHTKRGKLHERRHVPQNVVLGILDQVEWNVDAAANHGQNEEDVSAHLGEAQENGSVNADLLDKQLLASLDDGANPGEDAFGDSGWGVLLVGML